MPPAVDRAPTLPSPLSGRRLLTRLASPFASKSRSVAEFYVEVDNPHRQYSPGDVVTGHIKLRVAKAIRVTHITASLHGYVQVFKNPGSPGEGFRANGSYLGTGRGKKSGEYFGNGFASLFEDEQPLCGEGRLNEGTYQFQFELQFPDDSNLPSSIDFERGTISYMLSATLTRPTTISPTISDDRKVYFVEHIDISPIYAPKERTITLEPISKRSRAKHQARKLVDPSERRSRRGDSASQSDLNRTSGTSAASARADGGALSPSPSEISFESMPSSNDRTSQAESSDRGSDGSRSNGSKATLGGRTITATVQPLNGGCLRGDSFNVKVTVNHTKPIKSLNGVIVTLYRQARVDMHPAIPLGPTEKGTEKKYEDYYPRSMTGLGGLSLSGAGSSHVFRKDLAQTMAPLYIDPSKLSTEVNARVRVPDDVFPTISTVPGSMISFKYFVEVLVDIQGKLASQDRNVAGLNIGNPRPQMGNLETGEPQALAMPFGSSVVDTTPIRRDKGVVTCTFEIVIGTRDSARRKGKRKVEVSRDDSLPEEDLQSQTQAMGGEGEASLNMQWQDQTDTRQRVHWQHPPDGSPEVHAVAGAAYDQPMYYLPPPVPMPKLPDESQMSEKERMRQAETRLLPSQPPGMEAEGSGVANDNPTAPYLPEESVMTTSVTQELPAPAYTSPLGSEHGSLSTEVGRNATSSSAPAYTSPLSSEQGSLNTEVGRNDPASSSAPAYDHTEATSSSSAPAYDHEGATSSSRTPAPVTDDKHELQRRHLEAEASAPPEEDAVDQPSEATAPSAPTAAEAEEHTGDGTEFDSHAEAAGSSELPQYER